MWLSCPIIQTRMARTIACLELHDLRTRLFPRQPRHHGQDIDTALMEPPLSMCAVGSERDVFVAVFLDDFGYPGEHVFDVAPNLDLGPERHDEIER